jgi:hypothetical protein
MVAAALSAGGGGAAARAEIYAGPFVSGLPCAFVQRLAPARSRSGWPVIDFRLPYALNVLLIFVLAKSALYAFLPFPRRCSLLCLEGRFSFLDYRRADHWLIVAAIRPPKKD